MPLVRRAAQEIISYRLGYSPNRPYPWPWTTPITLCIFFLLSVLLAAINVPLSAYDIGQESTDRPNDTLPPLPFSQVLPKILQHPTGIFTPRILIVGDTIQLNNSEIIFTIAEAFDELDHTHPVTSFSYYNNPFSDGCDVTNMTAALQWEIHNKTHANLSIILTVVVTCNTPTLFRLTWSADPCGIDSAPHRDLCGLVMDLIGSFSEWRLLVAQRDAPTGRGVPTVIRSGAPILVGDGTSSFIVTVLPCCNCDDHEPPANPSSKRSQSAQASCDSLPARFKTVTLFLNDPLSDGSAWETPNTTDILTQLPDGMKSYFPDTATVSVLDTLFRNIFQSYYSVIRLEVGVIHGNQIYASPHMYNDSISNVYAPIPYIPSYDYHHANYSRLLTSDTSVMSDWQETVRIFQDSDRVPVMSYLRPVPRLKPLGSAITSVFVSTFSMLSVLWTVFSVVAATIAGSHADQADRPTDVDNFESECPMESDLEECKDTTMAEWDASQASLFVLPKERKVARQTSLERLNLTVKNNSIRMNTAMAEIQFCLSRVVLSLKRHGIMEDGEETKRIEVESKLRDVEDLERHPVLMYRTHRGSALDSAV
ncbi:hypothetical protein DFH09DRAFT_1364719 [Mycena vulgaris]|nr:hypothetical protein DFH09DRAFT_1364719 [Mycena vulgaris]